MQIVEILKLKNIQPEIIVSGWVRTKRIGKNVAFIALNDGSTIKNIQIVVESNCIEEETLQRVTTGSCIKVTGKLVQSKGVGQDMEVLCSNIFILGDSSVEEYPIQPKKHSLEFLRENAHLRFRTNTFSAVFRIRHALSFAIHKFFNDNNFINLHTPIITSIDAEGAGEMFQVTTLNMHKHTN